MIVTPNRIMATCTIVACLSPVVVIVALAQPQPPVVERVIESDLAWCNLKDLQQGDFFRHEGDIYIRCHPEPAGRVITDPDDQHKWLQRSAWGEEVICVRVSGVRGGPGNAGPERGGAVLINEEAYVQRVAVQLIVTRTK